MKKFLALLLSLVLIFSFAACGKKAEKIEEEPETEAEVEVEAEDEAEDEPEEDPEDTEEPEEYTQAYWEEKYPDYNICPFYINVNGEDIPYYWISALIEDDDIGAWAETALNWDGWHIAGDKVVDKDEKFAVTEESRAQSFSSCCVYETEPYEAPEEGGTEAADAAEVTVASDAEWPDIELTSQVPAPDAEYITSVEYDETMFLAGMHWYPESYEEYVQKLKDAGFTNDMNETSDVIELFSADNGEYAVKVSINGDYEETSGNGAISIEKIA